MLHVSRKMIQIKAKAIDEKTNDPAVKKTFIASSDWIQNFMERHHLSMKDNIYFTVLILIRCENLHYSIVYFP